MDLKIFEVDTNNPKHIKKFIEIPYRLYANVPQWVPPLQIDAKKPLDKNNHPFYKHSDAAFFIATNQSGAGIGRIAVLNNRNYNDFNHSQTAFFYLFECEDCIEIAKSLFSACIDWAKSQYLTKIIGSKGFSVLDGLGILVKGFEYRPAFGIPYNLPYYSVLIEESGFQIEGELVSGYIDRSYRFPERIQQIAETVKKRRGYYIKQYNSRRDIIIGIRQLKELYNSSLGETSGNVPLTDDEVKALSDQMMWFADPKLIKIVMKENEPVGFLFAYPDISAALQRTRGKLFPLGWLDMLIELRKTKWININGAGMKEGHRGLGGTAILFTEMYKSIFKSSYHYADIVQIGVENEKMHRELRDICINFYKSHRTYTMDI